jgi:reverse gyrase
MSPMIDSCNDFLDDGAIKNIQNLLQKRMVEGISFGLIAPVIVCGTIFYVIVTVYHACFQRFDFDRYIIPEKSLRYFHETILLRFLIDVIKKDIVFAEAYPRQLFS